MKEATRVSVGWPVLIVAAIALSALGSGLTYFVLRTQPAAPIEHSMASTVPSDMSSTGMERSQPSPPDRPDAVVELSDELLKRSGIELSPATAGNVSAGLRLPGVVEPNAYREVPVTPLIGGRVTQVFAELGQRVQRGQMMAEIASPELAEARGRYLAVRAELAAHERELRRTEALAGIGAASREELERVQAEHAAQIADLRAQQARLELFGAPPGTEAEQSESTASIRAPIDGVVTERLINVGHNVEPVSKLFVIVDLSAVWILADVYEQDLPRVQVGSLATLSTLAHPDQRREGRVSYVDPRVDDETRTAKVRIEVQNPDQTLRFGMFVNVEIADLRHTAALVIPRAAVQTIDDTQVVYVADENRPGRFIEREVHAGASAGEQIEILAGLRAGDMVVVGGSFLLRAERERLARQAPSMASHASMTDTTPQP